MTEKSFESNDAIPLFVAVASSPDIVTVLFDPEVSIPSPANIFNACVFKFTLPDPKEAVYINVDAIPVNPEPSPSNEPLNDPLKSPDAVVAVNRNLFITAVVDPNPMTVVPTVKLDVANEAVGKPPSLTFNDPPEISIVLPST